MKNKGLYIILLALLFIGYSCQNEKNEFDQISDKIDLEQQFQEGDLTPQFNFTSKVLSPSEYVKWVKDPLNGLVKTKQINDLQFSITYLPSLYMICNDLKKDKITKNELLDLSIQYEDFEYYLLKIEALESELELAKYKVRNQAEYEERIKYYSFGMQRDIIAEIESETQVPCELYHFERTYNITPYSSFLIGFPKDAIGDSKERTIVLNEQIFNKGLVKFKWTTAEQDNIPQIELL
jgi:hypothetical protein